MIGICPNFGIDIDNLRVVPGEAIIASVELLSLLTQLKTKGAKSICILVGYGLLYWDFLLLDSLKKRDSKLEEKSEEKSKQKETFKSMLQPNAAAMKLKAQEYERNWLANKLV